MSNLPGHIIGACALVSVLLPATASPAAAQWMLPRSPLLEVVIDATPYLNAYELGGNPAYLRSGVHPQSMNLRLVNQRKSGEMAGFVEPGFHSRLQEQATVRRDFGDVHVVQGGFAVEQDRRSDWVWLANRDYEDAPPFVFGDSTSGSSRYNALILEGAYSREIGNRWTTGVAVAYRVDNGLKKVSPRPTSEHRDVRAVVGARFRLWDDASIGAHVRLDDLQEEIRYRTDEGAVLEDTRLLKFRGYDRPQVVNSQVETRFSGRKGVFGGLATSLERERLRVVVHTEYGSNQGDVRDDLLSQRSEGYWAGNELRSVGATEVLATEALTLGLRFDLLRQSRWARHPQFNVLMADYERLDRRIVIGIAYQMTQAVRSGLEIHLSGRSIDEVDYFADIDHALDGVAWELRAGAEARLPSVEMIAAAGFGGYTADHAIEAGDLSRFYSAFRRADIEILGQNQHVVRGALGVRVDPPIPGRIRFDTRLAVSTAAGGFFEGYRRTDTTVGIVYEVTVF